MPAVTEQHPTLCWSLRSVAVVAAALGVGACRPVHLQPGTGGLRVHVRGARDGQHATVTIRVGGTAQHAARVVETTDATALFVDVPPDFYDVVAYADDGRAGFYRAWTSNNGARVEPDRVEDVDVTLASGIAVVGRVLDATTGQPLAGVDVQPPPHVASVTWPSTLPGLWAETRRDGSFAIGGLEALAPVTPGSQPGPRVRAWLTFARAGYVTQTRVLDPAGSSAPRAIEVRLVPGPAPGP